MHFILTFKNRVFDCLRTVSTIEHT